jgi:uncharacterized protein YndB with AHSA1/START domain
MMSAAARPRSTTRDFRLTVRIRAHPDVVYKSLTSARELTRWWVLGAETDARNTGKVRMVWPRELSRDGKGAPGFGERRGVFVDLEPGHKVAWMFRPARGEKDVPALVSVFIEERRGACDVTLLHAGFPRAASAFAAYARSWEDGLAKLKLYLETGRTCKLQAVDLETARILSRSRA